MVLIVFAMILLQPRAEAAINPQINFQGKLTNTNGTNVTNGTYSILFSIYTVSSGGSAVWTETQASVSVTDGIFRVALGSVTALPGSVDFNSSSLYLGIKVGADPEMSPRVQFTAAPYAFNSDTLDGIDSSGFVRFASGSVQTDASTNALIFLNKTSTGNLLQLQKSSSDAFVVGNTGLITTASVNGTSVVNDALDFAQLADALSLDATTTISLGTNNFTTNLSSTGDYTIQFGGNTVFQILDTGAVTIGSILADQTIGLDNGTGTINISTDSDANTTNIGTGTAADTVTIGDANANVAITDAQWSVSGAGAASFASISGAGLSDCDQGDDVLKWDSTTGQFSCGTNRATFSNVMDGNYTNATNGFTDVDNAGDATDKIGFSIGANETWVFEASMGLQSNTTADANWRVTAPTGSTCDISVSNLEQALSVANLGCSTATTSMAVADTNYNEIQVHGAVTSSTTTGTVVVQFAQVTASGTSTISSGSFINAYRISGADYAELYYTDDQDVKPGMLVELTGTGPSQVRKSTQPYSDRLIGVYSTSPGSVIGSADGYGRPIPIALSGRVPILLSTENGVPRAGDVITSSHTMPGYGMVATASGDIVGQMMIDAIDNGDGTASGYVYVRHGYWQAPLPSDSISVLGTGALQPINSVTNETSSALGDMGLLPTTPSFDKAIMDRIVGGFNSLQLQIDGISDRIGAVEQSWGVMQSTLLAEQLMSDGENGLVVLNAVRFDGPALFKNEVLFNEKTAGEITIKANETSADVVFDPKLSRRPKIAATPNDFVDTSWRVTNIEDSGFRIELSKPLSKDVQFTWQLLLAEEPPKQ